MQGIELACTPSESEMVFVFFCYSLVDLGGLCYGKHRIPPMKLRTVNTNIGALRVFVKHYIVYREVPTEKVGWTEV